VVARVIAGRYELEEELGRGGMGAVWRATDQVLGRTVALKKIGVAPGGFSPEVERAEREARLAARLSHANVVAVFDLVSERVETDPEGDQQQWLVMEYVEGTDLSRMVAERGPLSPDEVAPLLAQTAAALAAAHGAGIVHRDVKPSNILVTPSGQVKLSDFGIARRAADPALTQTGLVTGSPAYLSPEVASGQSATPASDVWSWGATMFHALEGRPPYDIGENLLGALYRIVHEEPPRPRSSGWLTPVLEGTMTRDPAQRWEIRDAQSYLEDGAGQPHPTPVPTGRTVSYDEGPAAGTTVLPSAPPPPPRPTPVAQTPPPYPPPSSPPPSPPSRSRRAAGRRRPWLLIVLLALLLVVAMVIAFQLGLGGNDDEPTGAPTPPSASRQPSESASPSPSESAAPPSAGAMTDFVSSYLQTVVDDPAAAFAQLTPEFQEASGGFASYEGFWGPVRRTEVEDISANPEALTVSYRYRYVRAGEGSRTEQVTLQLAYDGSTFLIAGEG
jgi:eukaryotic-like serine/threonine-protein kinase